MYENGTFDRGDRRDYVERSYETERNTGNVTDETGGSFKKRVYTRPD